jgi:hypothetical protein
MAEALADILERLLSETPGQTPQELYSALGRHRSRVRGVTTVATVLRDQRDRFVATDDGRWCVRDSRRGVRITESHDTGLRDGVAGDRGAYDATALERELEDRLRGCRMVCEIGLDAALHERVEAALGYLLTGTGDIDRIGRIYPALLGVYLVGHGVYRYQGGTYWSSMPIPQLREAGPAFERALRRLGLETFENIVVGDGAHRFVGPIVAHGGIPKYSLGDYFGLLARGLRRAAMAEDLLSMWRSQKTSFVQIDRPVRRFMLFGGDLAIDYIDRSIDLFREHARSSSVIPPAQVGLPPYVVASFKKFIAELGGVPIAESLRRESRARIVIDPWDGTGPVAELPIHRDAGADSAWRVHGEGQRARRRSVGRTPRSRQRRRRRSARHPGGVDDHGQRAPHGVGARHDRSERRAVDGDLRPAGRAERPRRPVPSGAVDGLAGLGERAPVPRCSRGQHGSGDRRSVSRHER